MLGNGAPAGARQVAHSSAGTTMGTMDTATAPSSTSGPAVARQPAGLFVGVSTLDLIYLVERTMGANDWQRALNYLAVAGGSATGAAVAFAALGGSATLVTAVGAGPLGDLVRSELAGAGVTVIDTTPTDPAGPVVACALVQQSSGERAIVSRGGGSQVPAVDSDLLVDLLAGVDVVLVDSYRPSLTLPAARAAKAAGVPVVMDADQWDGATTQLLGAVDAAVCAAGFIPAGAGLGSVLAAGPTFVAVSRGGAAILWQTKNSAGQVAVPSVAVVDTLGAGDVLHGAFAYGVGTRRAGGGALTDDSLEGALIFAAPVASAACEHFGTRAWIAARAAQQGR